MATTGTTIQTEIERLTKAKSDIKTAIINKGGTISDTATIDKYAAAIDGISTGGGVPIVAYGKWGLERLVSESDEYKGDTPPPTTEYAKHPSTYSTKEGYFPSLFEGGFTENTELKESFILQKSLQGLSIRPYILPELPKDGVFRLYNDYGLYIGGGTCRVPGIYIIHKNGSSTLYNPTNFEFKMGSFLKGGSYLEYTGIDFSDCIMIGIGVGQMDYFD